MDTLKTADYFEDKKKGLARWWVRILNIVQLVGSGLQTDPQIQHNSYKNSGWAPCVHLQTGLKIHTEIQETHKGQNNLGEKKQSWRTHNTQFQTHCQAKLCGAGIRIEIKVQK